MKNDGLFDSSSSKEAGNLSSHLEDILSTLMEAQTAVVVAYAEMPHGVVLPGKLKEALDHQAQVVAQCASEVKDAGGL